MCLSVELMIKERLVQGCLKPSSLVPCTFLLPDATAQSSCSVYQRCNKWRQDSSHWEVNKNLKSLNFLKLLLSMMFSAQYTWKIHSQSSSNPKKVRLDSQDNSAFCFQLLSIQISFHVDTKYGTLIETQHLPARQPRVTPLQLYRTACLFLLKIYFQYYVPSILRNVSYRISKSWYSAEHRVAAWLKRKM